MQQAKRKLSSNKPAKPRDLLGELDGLRELHQLLRQIERTREQQRLCQHAIEALLEERDLALYELVRMFRANNGATSRDLEQFLPRYFACKVSDGPSRRLQLIADDGKRTLFTEL
jgi:hypothetical protein